MRKRIAIAAVLSLCAACGGGTKAPAAGTAGAAAPAPAQQTRGSSRDIITKAEIEQTQGVPNAYDLVRRLRPNFLRVEGRTSMGIVPQQPLVRLNGSVLGDINSLRSVDVTGLEEIRFYSIVEAETKWSGEHGRPVIAVTTRKLTGK